MKALDYITDRWQQWRAYRNELSSDNLRKIVDAVGPGTAIICGGEWRAYIPKGSMDTLPAIAQGIGKHINKASNPPFPIKTYVKEMS